MNDRSDMVARYTKGLAPFAMGLLGVFLLAMPMRLFEGVIPMPIIPLAVIFFWTIYDPERLPSSSVFMIGLFQDALIGEPLGLWSSIYLAIQFIVLSQRSYFLGRELQVVWAGFGLVSAGAALAVWLIMSLMAGYLLPIRDLILQVFTTVMFYPVMGQVFREIRHRVLVEV